MRTIVLPGYKVNKSRDYDFDLRLPIGTNTDPFETWKIFHSRKIFR